VERISSSLLLRQLSEKKLSAHASAAHILWKTEEFLRQHFLEKKGFSAQKWKNNTLYLTAENSAVAQHLFLQKTTLLLFLKEEFPATSFLRVRIEINPPPKDKIS